MNEAKNTVGAFASKQTKDQITSHDAPYLESFSYDDAIVRMFSLATLTWGLVATLIGLIVAILLVMPQWTFIEYISFGGLNAAISMPISSLTVVAISMTTGRAIRPSHPENVAINRLATATSPCTQPTNYRGAL